MNPQHQAVITTLADAISQAADADVYLYNSGIGRPDDDQIIELVKKRRRRTNVVLLLTTEGGDPDAAYRIARCFQRSYSKFTCLVAGYCKSAGTLITVGANELVMADSAELGPLDVQMSKRDELWEAQSGLLVTTALNALHQSSFNAFEHFFMTIKKKSKNAVTLKTATEIAAKVTAGLFAPIYQQVDPLYVGEAQRAQAIGQQYGLRLSGSGRNISEDSLDYLIASYPTHGFVIDRMEAQALFKRVREPNAQESALLEALGARATIPASNTVAVSKYLSTELPAPPEPQPQGETQEQGNDAGHPEHQGNPETGRPDGETEPPQG